MNDFADRLDPESYRDEEPVRVTCPETTIEAWVPESIFHRMECLGRGYGLHTLSLLGPDHLRSLSVSQAHDLGDEIAFLAEVTNDPALHEQLSAVSGVISSGIAARRAEAAVVFEWS